MSGQFMWFDVTATDPSVTAEFYAKLLGWATGPADGAEPYRAWIVDDGRPLAGVVPASDAIAGRWLPYVNAPDLDATAERATALGGTVIRDRTDGPAGTSIVIADPGGALVALFAPR